VTLPIYEYTCRACEAKFERLVRSMSDADTKINCPECGSAKTTRAFSVFAVGAESTRSASSSSPPGCGRCGGPGPCPSGY
jgi:putative FmdB family regulatory protein